MDYSKKADGKTQSQSGETTVQCHAGKASSPRGDLIQRWVKESCVILPAFGTKWDKGVLFGRILVLLE